MNDGTTRRPIEVDGFSNRARVEAFVPPIWSHPGLVRLACTDLAQLGGKIDDLAVVCIGGMKAIPLKNF